MTIFKTILNTIPRPYLLKMSYLASPLLGLFYKGNTYTDPIDGRKYRKLLPYGYGEQRPNALAPGSLSLERHRLIWLYLKNETDFFTAPKKMLHIAPEQCFLERFKKMKHIEYTTADLMSPLADVKADVCNLPFQDNAFDVVFCNHVLEHVTDDAKAMSELYRVLKPGGLGIFQIPQEIERTTTYEDFSITSPEERSKHFGQYDHVRVYGMDYFDKLRAVGFKVDAVKYAQTIPSDKVTEYCLVPHEILPVCTK
ncbi:MAG: class I SAM-dependent methyltransferase [Flavobacteriaceae bacterium]|nr:class I SAM-dependent methyltransferase [Flavobacteriaceae bacterium]